MVAYRFENTEWDIAEKQVPKDTQPIGDLRFRHLFNEREWKRLPLAVRKRFGQRVTKGDALIYRGHVEHNRVNRWGFLLTQLLRVIGAPLPLDTDNEGAAAVVTVTEAPGLNGQHGGQVWMRQYARTNPKKPFPQIIQSAKRFEGTTGIEEYIGRGIGMSLKAIAHGNELAFIAQDIFWDIKLPRGNKLRMTLPRWLGPTLLRAGHEELGNGTFAFTLKLEHKWFGMMVDQRVWFKDDLNAQHHIENKEMKAQCQTH